jgi:hypothetical protein
MDNLVVADLVPGIDYSVRPQKDFKGLLASETKTSFGAQITRLLKFNLESSKSDSTDMSAEEGRIYELVSPKKLFKKICEQKVVQEFLVDGISMKDNTYFVVGWRTFTDAKVGTTNETNDSIKAEGVVPVGEIVEANIGASIGDAADVAGSIERTRNNLGQESYTMEGEYIYAIEYRKIRANKKDVSISRLEKDATWRMYSDTRETMRHKVGEGVREEPEEDRYEDYEAVLADIDDLNSAEGIPKEAGSKQGNLVTETGEEYIILK